VLGAQGVANHGRYEAEGDGRHSPNNETERSQRAQVLVDLVDGYDAPIHLQRNVGLNRALVSAA